MTTEYTARNRAIKQETGSNLNVWGTVLNNQALDMFDESLDGVESVDLGAAATFDLSDAAHTKNGESDTSRQRVLIFSNTHASGTAITIPSVEKWYFIRNSASQAITLAPSGGSTASVPAGADAIVFSDGTNCYAFRARLNELAAPNGAVSMNSQRLTNVADATDPADAVNKAQVEALTDADVQLAEDWAKKTNGFVEGSENSAKSWAVGGTGDGDPAAGSAKEWATSTSTVDGGLKGARGYANDASGSASAASTSAGNAATSATNAYNSEVGASTWATSTSVVSGGFKGARGYAEDAAASKEAFDDIWVTSASEPGSPVAGMVWFDTSGNVLKVRDATNTVWQTVTGINAASESTAGVIEIATQAETNTGTDDTRAVTPKKLADGDYSVKRQYQEFLSSGTWNKPTGIGWIYVELVGGGGGGSRGNASVYGNGGGGGGFNSRLMRASDASSSVTVTVGAGGAASAATNISNGGDGGDSTFGSYATAKGGKGGVGTTSSGAGGAGSAGGSTAGVSAYADASGNYRGNTGGNSIKGGGGGGGATTGGASVDAGAGGAGVTGNGNSGVAGSQPGGGGGGCEGGAGAQTSGAGGAGRVRVWAW